MKIMIQSSQKILLALLLAFTVTACTNNFKADVTRFTHLPPPTGQTFYLTALDQQKSQGLEFASYAALVGKKLEAYGYRAVTEGEHPDLVVRFDYNIDDGRERIVSDTGNYSLYSGYWGYRGFRRPFGRSGFRGGYYPFAYGFYDPFLYGGYGFSGYGGVRSYTVYGSEVQLQIEQAASGKPVFDGRAQAQSRSSNLPYIVPNLVEALFSDFPGNDGESVRITIAPEKK